MILFLYGTLLDPATLARWSGDRSLVRRLRPARLEGHARVCLRGTPWPTLLRRPGTSVAGALLRLSPAAFHRLSAYEGAAYRLVPLRLTGPRGPCRVRGWVAPPWRARGSAEWRPAQRKG